MDFLVAAYDIAEIVIPVAAIPFVARDHRPHVAIGWLVFIAFLPLVGLAAYIYLGWLRLRHRRGSREAVSRALQPIRDAVADRSRSRDDDVAEAELRRLFRRVGGETTSIPLRGNRVRILEDDALVEALVRELESATETADLVYYLFVEDHVGRRVGAALADAARRGVRCRLLIGSISAWVEGQRSAFATLTDQLEDAGVAVHPLRPVNPLRNQLQRVDLRNHRKLAVVDGRIAYVGSQNIHDPDSGLEEGTWLQLNAEIEGPAAAMLQTLFLEDWYLETGIPESVDDGAVPAEVGDAVVQVVGSQQVGTASELLRMFVGAIHQANTSLTICTPYFVPDEATSLALQIAAQRGVEIRLILPRESDKWIADAAARAFLDELVPAGVHVHLHDQGGTLHAKAMVVDDEIAYVGSGNLDRRSMFLDDEVGVVVSEASALAALATILERYRSESTEIEADAWRKRSRFRQHLDHSMKLLSPIL